MTADEGHPTAVEDDVARLTAAIANAEREERLRLAEALHDDALQRLFAARQDLAEASAHTDDRRLHHVDGQLEELAASLRGLVTAMHDQALEAAPLEEGVQRLADDAGRRGRLDVRTQVDPRAGGGHDGFLLDVVRELLANVVKHAGASRASVEVDVPDGNVRLAVQDDGVGIDPGRVTAAGADGHLGHARLRRRMAAVEGVLEVLPAPGGGTVVSIVVPLDALRAQRALEDELRRERRWSAALVAAIQDGFVVFHDGRVVQVNERFCAMTGHTRADVLASADDAPGAWPAEQRELLLAYVLRGRRERRGEQEATLRRRDGSTFPALVAGRGIRDEDGRHGGMLVTVRDVTERHEAEARGRREAELTATLRATTRLRGLLEAALDVGGPEGLAALLDAIGQLIHDDLGWSVVINLHRRAWDDFIVTATYGLPADASQALEGKIYDWADWSVLQERFERRGAYVVPADMGEDAWAGVGGAFWSPPPSAEAPGPDTWQPDDALFVPVRRGDGAWLGLLSLDLPVSGRRPADAELDVLTAAAGVIGIALQRATESIAAATHRATLQRLLRVSSLIAGARELGPVVDRVVAAIIDALGFERVVVDALDPDDGCLHVRAVAGLEPGEGPGGPVAPEQLAPLLDVAFGVEGCYLLPAAELADRLPAARSGRPPSRRNGRGPQAWCDHGLVVPLYGPEDDMVGVIWVDDPVDHLLPGAERLQALRAFANQAAAAFVSAEAFQRVRHVSDDDPLATLANRRALDRELLRASAPAERAASPSELVLVELGGLAGLPRPAAGAVLRGLARILEEESRAADRAFVVADGLFALLLAGVSGPQLDSVTRRLRLQAARLDARLEVRVGRTGVEAVAPAQTLARARAALTADADVARVRR